MGYYPIMIDLAGKSCLVVGGGEVALRKVISLTEAGARVRVIAPEIDTRIAGMSDVETIRREYRNGDAFGCMLVFAATGDQEINVAVFQECERNGIPVNVVDDPDLCSFIVPSVVKRGDLMIAISTSGSSPALSKKLRRELEQLFGREYAEYIDLLGEMRKRVKAQVPDQNKREEIFKRILDSDILDLIRSGRKEDARNVVLDYIEDEEITP